MAAAATSLRPICWAICSKLSFLAALALKRVSDEAGRLGCWEVCIREEISSIYKNPFEIGNWDRVLHRELRET